MLDAFITLLKMVWLIVKYPFYLLSAVSAFFIFLVFMDYLYLRICKKIVPIKGIHNKLKKVSIFKRLFIRAPMQYAKDVLRRDPETFKYQGIIIFEGRQGHGKTVSMIEQARRYQKEYPKAVCLSNLKYKYADAPLESWDDIIDFQNPNGPDRGVIVINDELQNSFNSKKSKDFPMEYVGIVTQNRKNRRVLLGTAQNFYMLSKDIRSQCTELRKCFTFLGCVTFVRIYEPIVTSEGDVEELKFRGIYFYVHDDDLRSSYDTYEVIKGFKKSGFKPRSEQVSAATDKRKVVEIA